MQMPLNRYITVLKIDFIIAGKETDNTQKTEIKGLHIIKETCISKNIRSAYKKYCKIM